MSEWKIWVFSGLIILLAAVKMLFPDTVELSRGILFYGNACKVDYFELAEALGREISGENLKNTIINAFNEDKYIEEFSHSSEQSQ